MNKDKSAEEANQIYHELHNVIRRWMDEGDELTTFGIIGALEAVKHDLMDSLVKHNRGKE